MSAAERAACAAINRERARGILEATKLAPPGKPLSLDVWTALVARRIREWDFALIPLSRLGLSHDKDGFITSHYLSAMKSGAEASPYCDKELGVVYKLFDLRRNGALGKKITFERNESGEYELTPCDAVLMDTLEKIMVLHDAGAHPTEIVGLSDTGDYLVVKQPQACEQPYSAENLPAEFREQFERDRAVAIEDIRGVPCHCPGMRQTVVVCFVQGQPWLVADLHHRNIMRNHEGRPTIIDALIGPVTRSAYKQVASLARTVDEAKNWLVGGLRPLKPGFDEIDDDTL